MMANGRSRPLVTLIRMAILPDSDRLEAIGDRVMAVKLRFKRMGRSNAAFFRLSAIDSRSPRDGRVIEELGHYNPRDKDKSKQFVAKLDRCKHWLDVGAVPSETVSSLLKKAGLEHKQLRLPRPGKPKVVAAPAGEKKEETKA
jgi:small subunit ribosomal protein S16